MKLKTRSVVATDDGLCFGSKNLADDGTVVSANEYSIFFRPFGDEYQYPGKDKVFTGKGQFELVPNNASWPNKAISLSAIDFVHFIDTLAHNWSDIDAGVVEDTEPAESNGESILSWIKQLDAQYSIFTDYSRPW